MIRVKCRQWILKDEFYNSFPIHRWIENGFKYGTIQTYVGDHGVSIKAIIKHDDGTFKDYRLDNIFEEYTS